MTVLLVIDHFGPGGAQRQLGELGLRLQKRGHRVHGFTYFPHDETGLGRALADSGVTMHRVQKSSRFSPAPVWALRRIVRQIAPDVVLSYLRTPSAYAALATRGTRSAFIPSERCTDGTPLTPRPTLIDLAVLRTFRWSARVVANSYAQRDWLKATGLFASDHVLTILNGVNLDRFTSTPLPDAVGALRLLAVGRVGPEKNPDGLARGLVACQARGMPVPHVRWAGPASHTTEGAAAKAASDRILADAGLTHHWTWLGLRDDVPGLLSEHDALIHPALHEGMPNVIAEAFAAGRPVLAGWVADHAALVAEGQRGFLFEPTEPESMAEAIHRFHALDQAARQRLGTAARAFATAELDMERCVDRYEQVFAEAMTR